METRNHAGLCMGVMCMLIRVAFVHVNSGGAVVHMNSCYSHTAEVREEQSR